MSSDFIKCPLQGKITPHPSCESPAGSRFYIHQVFIETTNRERLCAERLDAMVNQVNVSCLHGATIQWGRGLFRLRGDTETGVLIRHIQEESGTLWTYDSVNM